MKEALKHRTTAALVVQEINGREQMLAQHALIQLLNPQMSLERYEQLLTHMLANGYRMVGAFAGETCIGLSGFWISSKLYSGKYLEVDNFVVAEAYRSAGVGKLLADWMEEEAQRHHCDTIMLDAYVTNSAAHRFYFREGYHIKSYHFFKSL
jgi:GNAT superfamily N-acetyltransferase